MAKQYMRREDRKAQIIDVLSNRSNATTMSLSRIAKKCSMRKSSHLARIMDELVDEGLVRMHVERRAKSGVATHQMSYGLTSRMDEEFKQWSFVDQFEGVAIGEDWQND